MNDITIAMIVLVGIIFVTGFICAFVFGKDYEDKEKK